VICKPSRKKASLHGIQTMNGFSVMMFLSGLDHPLYVTVRSLRNPSIVVLRCKRLTTIWITEVNPPKFPDFRLLAKNLRKERDRPALSVLRRRTEGNEKAEQIGRANCKENRKYSAQGGSGREN
jgi:hypothetical protein